MIVLDGDTSQWKRSAWPSRAIGPAVGSPAAIRSIASRCGRMVAGSRSGAKAARRFSSSAIRAPRKRVGRHSRTTPTLRRLAALDAAAGRGRSRTGTRYAAARARSASSTKGRGASSRRVEIADVGRALCRGVAGHRIVGQPRVGERGDEVGQSRLVDPGRVARVGGLDRPGVRQQHVVARSARTAGGRARPGRARCGGCRAPRRGRSATAGRARRAGSGSAPSGRGS